MAETDEQTFYDAVRGTELDLRYLDICRKHRAAVGQSQDDELDLAEITAVVERLPLPFKYVKSETFFQYREKLDGATLFFHLRLRHDLVTPMILLETEEYAFGEPFARLSLRIMKTREEYELPEPRELGLPFSSATDLFTALELATSLFLDASTELKAAGPWGVRPGR